MKPPEGLIVPKSRYYDVLLNCVKPFIDANKDWIKSFYYTHYYDKNTPYQVKVRVGVFKQSMSFVQEKLKSFSSDKVSEYE